MLHNRHTFTDSTCDGLTGLLLRASAIDLGSPAEWFTTCLRELAYQDAALLQWLTDNGLQDALSPRTLCRQLVRDSIWHSSEEGWQRQVDGLSSPAARLNDCAFTLLRLAGLNDHFNDEMEAWQQRLLYNFAYGLSHELNNPLANIVTRAGLLAHRCNDPHSQNLLQTMIDNAHRGREMLGDLMLLARPPALASRPQQLRSVVQDLAGKVTPWCEMRQVEVELLETDEGGDICVLIDPIATAEALWAIVRNALEAMPTGGRLSICRYLQSEITTGTATTASSMATSSPATAWGVIEVSDTGPGLSSVALKNCFDPFYSGREAGRGLGMGLAKAKSLVDRQGGFLELENLPTTGCRVTLWLPACESSSDADG